MDFDRRQARVGDGVPDGIRIVGVRAGVDDDGIGLAHGFLHEVHNRAFGVGLLDGDFHAQILGVGRDLAVDRLKISLP